LNKKTIYLKTVKSSSGLVKFIQQHDQNRLNLKKKKKSVPEPVGVWFGWSLPEDISTWETYFN